MGPRAHSPIPVGIWSLEAVGYDSNETAIYSGKSTVAVIRDLSSSASITLEPMNGEFEITLDPSEYKELGALKIDIWVYPLGESRSVAHGEFSESFAPSLELVATNVKPRSYEYQIRAMRLDEEGVKLVEFYKSPWYIFSVLPGSKTSISRLGEVRFQRRGGCQRNTAKTRRRSFTVDIISTGRTTSASILLRP